MKKLLALFLVAAGLALAAVTLSPVSLLNRAQAEITTNPVTGEIVAVSAEAYYTEGATDGSAFYASTDSDGKPLPQTKVAWSPDTEHSYTVDNVTLNEVQIFQFVKAAADARKNPAP